MVVGTQQADKNCFEQGDGQRPAAEEDQPPQAPESVEDCVTQAQAQDRVEQQSILVSKHVDQYEAEHESKPADPQRDGLGGQLERVAISWWAIFGGW